MTWHTMILSEDDPHHRGFIRRYLARIDVVLSGSSWVWRQVDASGNYVGTSSQPQASEQDALDDALATLNGDRWE